MTAQQPAAKDARTTIRYVLSDALWVDSSKAWSTDILKVRGATTTRITNHGLELPADMWEEDLALHMIKLGRGVKRPEGECVATIVLRDPTVEGAPDQAIEDVKVQLEAQKAALEQFKSDKVSEIERIKGRYALAIALASAFSGVIAAFVSALLRRG